MQKIIDKFNKTLAEYQADYAGVLELEECIKSDTLQLEGIILQYEANLDLQELHDEIRYLDTLVREYFYDMFELIAEAQELKSYLGVV